MTTAADKQAMVHDLLWTIARSRPRPGDKSRLRACIASEPDWTAVVATALEHGLAGLLCRRMLTDAPDLLSEDIHEAARRLLEEASARYASGVAQLLALLTDLATAGVVAVPFKGPALAQAAYAEPALRGFRDLDILINETDLQAALTVLRQRGYRSQHSGLRQRHLHAYYRYNGQDVLFADSLLPVEPHWQFGQSTLAARMDFGAMIRRRVPMVITRQAISALSPEDALVAATFHGMKEEWTSAKGIVDVAELLAAFPNLDWDVLLHRAGQAGVRRIVLLGTNLARILLGAHVPEPVLRAIGADRALLRLSTEVTTRIFATPVVERSVFALSSFRWHARERMRDRLHYAVATTTTARIQHFQAVDLPDPLGFLYPVVKVAHDYVALPLWLATRTCARRLAPVPQRGKGADAA
jgi:hypothetical protein